jgi:hypothetical protein
VYLKAPDSSFIRSINLYKLSLNKKTDVITNDWNSLMKHRSCFRATIRVTYLLMTVLFHYQ